jgi:hypothetical protein
MRKTFILLLSLAFLVSFFIVPSFAPLKKPLPPKAKLKKIVKKEKIEKRKEIIKEIKALPPAERREEAQLIKEIRDELVKLPPAERKDKLNAYRAEMTELDLRLDSAGEADRIIIKNRLQRLRLALVIINEMEVGPPSPMPAGPMGPPARPKPTMARKHWPANPQYGLAVGYLGSIPGAILEMRYFEPFDLPSTSLRVGVAYAKGEDSNKDIRQHALVVLDGIYRLNPPWTPGIRSYFGAGLNYDLYTTGQKMGTVGGEIFYGGEIGTGDGDLYLEIGYGMVRTGFSPSYKGLTTVLGYRY